MVVSHIYQYNEEENTLIHTIIEKDGNKKVEKIQIYDKDGKHTPEFIKEINSKEFKKYYNKYQEEKEKSEEAKDDAEESKVEGKAKSEEVKDDAEESKAEEKATESNEETETVEEIERVEAEIVEPENTELIVPETKLAVINYEEAPEELKKKKKFTWKKFLIIAGIVGIGAFVISRFVGCGENQNEDTTTVTATPTPGVNSNDDLKVSPTPTPIIIPTVEEQLEDSRYTEITNEAFEETVFNLQQELISHGINLNGEDVVKFVALANFTHINETNPELLETIMGEETDPQQFITKAAQVIGQTVYLEVTDKNEQVNWTIALMDKKDKEIADSYMNNVVYAAKEYAEGDHIIEGGTYATRDEKRIHIETLVAEGYIAKDFDKTVDVQEIGADFVTDAIVTGILLSDNAIKPFISTKEVVDELTVISSNKDVVSNLHTLISSVGCKETAKTLTLN